MLDSWGDKVELEEVFSEYFGFATISHSTYLSTLAIIIIIIIIIIIQSSYNRANSGLRTKWTLDKEAKKPQLTKVWNDVLMFLVLISVRG
jgi:uncharacterized membrane protein YidH (DUF202 family)